MIYRNTNIKLKGIPRHGSKSLNFFTFFESKIGLIDGEGNDVNKSMVGFRFHSSKAFCNMTPKEHMKKHDIVHARAFIYDGIDKNEAQLIDWALNTEGLIANDEVTFIYGAQTI